MVKRILENGLNLKDENRLTNANQKLTNLGNAANFTYSDDVTPVMIAGVEENPTISSVNLITSTRDYNGNNRICVDNLGIEGAPSKGQIIFNNFVALDGTDSGFNFFVPDLTLNKHAYVKGLAITNSSGVAHDITIFQTHPNAVTTNLLRIIILAQSTTVINNYLCDLEVGASIQFQDNTSENGTVIVSYWGFYQ
jgi:hypothetical protein